MRFPSTLRHGVALACALTLASAPAALAATGTGESTRLHLNATTVHHASSGSSGIMRTIIALVVVIALIYVVARILKAVKGGGGGTHASGDGLTHLATLPLAPGKSVALVRSGTDVVLVGIAESGVTPIKTYTEAEALANGIVTPYADPAAAPTATSSGRLVDSLRRMTVRT